MVWSSSFGCAPPGCHRACAVGCIHPNDITACTTRYYGGRYRDCTRCADGYRSLNNQQYLGCTPGAKTDTSCVSPSPAPTPCVDKPHAPPCPGLRRRLEEDNKARRAFPCRRLEELTQTTSANGTASGNAADRQLQDILVLCSCDGSHVFTYEIIEDLCSLKESCTCTPGAMVPLAATCYPGC